MPFSHHFYPKIPHSNTSSVYLKPLLGILTSMALGTILAFLALLAALASFFIETMALLAWAVVLLALAFLIGGGNPFKT